MRKNRTTIARAAALVTFAGLAWACSKSGFTGVTLLDAPSVAMTDQLTFDPDTVTIQVNGTVTWANNSAAAHTVTCDPALAQDSADVLLPDSATAFNSDSIAPHGSFSHKFTVPGVYEYFSIPDEAGGMRGWVIVQ
ncbi:MAG TPA: plastocyanin/azurin family copper-binding protein [Longimicrobiales bacterium]|nr:plastocyanin/azurin family copper-binding protein [Longimicrobiales bacterium]